jgi:hypothetical protein
MASAMRRWRVVIDVRGVAGIHRGLLDSYLGHFEPVTRPHANDAGVELTMTVPAATLDDARRDAVGAVGRLVGGPVAVGHVTELGDPVRAGAGGRSGTRQRPIHNGGKTFDLRSKNPGKEPHAHDASGSESHS